MFSPLRTSFSHALKQMKRPSIVSSASHSTEVTGREDGATVPYRGDYSMEKLKQRRAWVENYTSSNLENIAHWWAAGHDPEILRDTIEMPIGLAKIPMAVAGPLQINGSFAQGKFLAPLAISEGAVVASTNRGASAINKCGGVKAYTSQIRRNGSPVFEALSPEDANTLGEWVKDQRNEIQREVVSEVSPNITLKEIFSVYDHEFVHLVLSYETSGEDRAEDTVLVTKQVARWIAHKAPKNVGLKRYWNESLLSGHRKCSKLNMIHGHGVSCGAEATITEEALRKNLGISPDGLKTLWSRVESWSERAMTFGSTCNPANIVGSVFAATGQDLGHCVDGSIAQSRFTVNEGPGGGLVYRIWFPSLVLSTQFNGCDLPTQRQSLELIGCYGPDKVRKLAEIIASFSVALDISTISAIASGHFASAHEKLGKNRPK